MKTAIRIISLTIILTLTLSVDSSAQASKRFLPESKLITIGMYYYPEHWPSEQWERDIKRIASMGFEFIHMSEFAWAQMEPEEGRFELGWLDEVIDMAEKHGMGVILGTPTATPPAWLGAKHPDTYLMNSSYTRAEHGTRVQKSLSNKVFKQYVERINTELAKRYGQNPTVLGWQICNEPEAKSDFSPSAQEAFRGWLQGKYGSIERLNHAWGTAFWSQIYSSFEQINIPNQDLVGWWGTNPHALLDFKRFTAYIQADFLDFQAATLREHIAPTQYITTNYTAHFPNADPKLTERIDFPTFTSYPNTGVHNLGSQGFRLGNLDGITFGSSYFRNSALETGIMEIQPGPANWGSVNPLLMPGTVRMWLWHSFGAGNSLICSYRFRQITYGTEQYHSGIMKLDGVTPSQGGKEYQQFINEIADLRTQYNPDAAVPQRIENRRAAIVWDHDNYWSLQNQGQTVQWDAWGFPIEYQKVLKSLGAPVDIISKDDDLNSYPFVVLPAFELVDSDLVERWEQYVAQGGNLIITCRTAIKNRDGHFWEDEWAAPIASLIGGSIEANDMLPPDVTGEVNYNSESYSWSAWADLIVPAEDATVLATYKDQFYAGKAAAVQRQHGEGTVTYVGVVSSDYALERDIIKDVYSNAGITTEMYPEGVTVYWRLGFMVAVNHSSETYTLSIPDSAELLVGSRTLEPAGVTVWME